MGETVPATGHTVELQNAKNATCTEDGYTGDEVCTVCGETVKVGEEIPATGHDWDEGKVTKKATCTIEGEMTYTCGACGETKTEVIPAKGHTVVMQNAKDATCTEDGYTGDMVCTECGEVLQEGKAIPATGHTWDEGKVTKEATCTVEGEMTYTCGACGETKTEAIPAKGHTVVVDKAVDATCTKTGLTEGSHCSECLEVLKKQETVPAKGHSFKDGKCTVCGEKDPNYKPASDSGKPNTGDNSMTLLWVVLLVVCGGGAAAMGIASKKKTYR